MNKSGCITWLIFCLCIYLLVYQTKIFLIILGCISIIIVILLLFSSYSDKQEKKKKLLKDLIKRENVHEITNKRIEKQWNQSNEIKNNIETKIQTTIEFNKLYTCEVRQGTACLLIFFKNGYVGLVDAVEIPIHNNIKSEIIKHFEYYLDNPNENLNHEFGKYLISNDNQISLYFAEKHDYFDGFDNLPYMYTGFKGVIENNHLLFDLIKKWYNQSLKKSEITVLKKKLLFKSS